MNAQEKTKKKLFESLSIGAQDMLATEIPFEPGSEMIMIEVPENTDAALSPIPPM